MPTLTNRPILRDDINDRSNFKNGVEDFVEMVRIYGFQLTESDLTE